LAPRKPDWTPVATSDILVIVEGEPSWLVEEPATVAQRQVLPAARRRSGAPLPAHVRAVVRAALTHGDVAAEDARPFRAFAAQAYRRAKDCKGSGRATLVELWTEHREARAEEYERMAIEQIEARTERALAKAGRARSRAEEQAVPF
jgi:hypothetical protein